MVEGGFYMSLVPAICTQCGAQIEVDNVQEAGICKYCGTAFITEKVINNYTANITAEVVNVYTNESAFQIDGHTLKAYNGKEKIVEIPEHILDIDKDAFNGNVYIQEVKLPFGLRKIGHSAFANCKNLKEIKIPDTVYSIEREAFFKCTSLERVELPTELPSLEMGLFSGCESLKIINIPNVRIIDSRCFGWCRSLKNIEIPSSVQSIGEMTFCNTNLERVIFKNENVVFKGCRSLFCNSSSVPKIIASDRFVKKNSKFFSISSEEINTNGCYIATCIYGSYECPQVWTLRRFRDYTLDKNWYGRIFIKCYYAVSPVLVKWFGNRKWFKTFWKKILDRVVYKLNISGVKNTKYIDKY